MISLRKVATSLYTAICLTLALVLDMSTGFAQPAPKLTVSPICEGATSASAASLKERKTEIEKSLAEKRAEFSRLRPSDIAAGGVAHSARTQLSKEIDALEGDLVDIIYLLECQRADWEPQMRTRAFSKPEFVSVTTYYATNRKATGIPSPAEYYGTEEAENVQYGRAVITIPSSHTLGNIELPSLWKLESNPDPSKHFVLKELTPLENAKALDELRGAVGKAGAKSLLIFVHGFNTTFAEAALRTAQLAHDLEFPGVPMFMSWPASRMYTHDVESVELAKGAFNTLLDDVAALPFDNVYILGHSMGTRLVARVLAGRKQAGADLSKIRDIMLAAPDINTHTFTTEIAPVLAGLANTRKTIYASSDDLALKASSAVNGYPRVGETSGGVRTFPGFDTIDCSKIAPLKRAWGHSYLFDSNVVIADLEDALIGGREAAKRKLKRTGVAPSLYWLLE